MTANFIHYVSNYVWTFLLRIQYTYTRSVFGSFPITGSKGKTPRNKQEIIQPNNKDFWTGLWSGDAIGHAANPNIPILKKNLWKKDTTCKKKVKKKLKWGNFIILSNSLFCDNNIFMFWLWIRKSKIWIQKLSPLKTFDSGLSLKQSPLDYCCNVHMLQDQISKPIHTVLPHQSWD